MALLTNSIPDFWERVNRLTRGFTSGLSSLRISLVGMTRDGCAPHDQAVFVMAGGFAPAGVIM